MESPSLTLDSAMTGTVIQIGHPGNGRSATKRADGHWYCNLTGTPMGSLDPRDATAVLLNPAAHRI